MFHEGKEKDKLFNTLGFPLGLGSGASGGSPSAAPAAVRAVNAGGSGGGGGRPGGPSLATFNTALIAAQKGTGFSAAVFKAVGPQLRVKFAAGDYTVAGGGKK